MKESIQYRTKSFLHSIGKSKENAMHSFVLPDGERIEGEHSLEMLQERFANINLNPEKIVGKSVLDLGGGDGYFSFELQKAGAFCQVVDVRASRVFKYVKSKTNLSVNFKRKKIEKLTVREIGSCDIVLMMAVFEQLDSPLELLSKI